MPCSNTPLNSIAKGLCECWPPCNPFTYRGSLQWSEVAPFIRRNAAPWMVPRFNYSSKQFTRMVTLMAWGLPALLIRRGEWKPATETHGHSAVETEAHAVVCNMAWIEGECPMANVPGRFEYNEKGEPGRMLDRPERGLKEAVGIMLHHGVLTPTVEVGLFVNDWAMIRRARFL